MAVEMDFNKPGFLGLVFQKSEKLKSPNKSEKLKSPDFRS